MDPQKEQSIKLIKVQIKRTENKLDYLIHELKIIEEA